LPRLWPTRGKEKATIDNAHTSPAAMPRAVATGPRPSSQSSDAPPIVSATVAANQIHAHHLIQSCSRLFRPSNHLDETTGKARERFARSLSILLLDVVVVSLPLCKFLLAYPEVLPCQLVRWVHRYCSQQKLSGLHKTSGIEEAPPQIGRELLVFRF